MYPVKWPSGTLQAFIPKAFREIDWEIGSGGRDRTYDQLINSQLLYR